MLNHARIQYLEHHAAIRASLAGCSACARASVGACSTCERASAGETVGDIFVKGQTGLDFLEAIAKLPPGVNRERKTLDWVRGRVMPPSLRDYESWPWVTLTDGTNKLEIQVSPDFWKLGGDEATAAMVPMWPTTAQAVADELSLRTINKKIARAVYEQAKIKGDIIGNLVNPGEPWYDMTTGKPRNIEDSGAIASSDKKRIAWLDKVAPGDRKGLLIAGHAKDVVHQGPTGSGDSVAIYGGGGGKNDGWAVQPFPGPHEWNYGPDYSHGIRLMRKKAKLNGKKVLIDDIFTDPKLSHLVSDGGPYVPRMKAPSDAALKVAKIDLPRGSPLLPLGTVGDADEAVFISDLSPEGRSPDEEAKVLAALDLPEPTAPRAPLTDAEVGAAAEASASSLKQGLLFGGIAAGLYFLWWVFRGVTTPEVLP